MGANSIAKHRPLPEWGVTFIRQMTLCRLYRGHMSAQDDEAEQWWARLLASKARGSEESISNYLHTLGDSQLLGDTRSTVHTHWVVTDPKGNPRIAQLAERLADEVVEYCIPRSRIDEAAASFAETGSMSKVVALHREAVSLFTRINNSGEGGELLLYFLLEVGLRIPQILCKMALKTSTQMHVHGVDGVHAKALDNGNLAVYWGESKMYEDFPSAVAACFKSIVPYLTDDGSGAAKRDILLVRDNLDVGSAELSLELVKFFTSDSPKASRLEIRGACLVGFSLEEYGLAHEADGKTVAPHIVSQMASWQAAIASRVGAESIEAIEIDVFCVPVPSSQGFREALRTALGLS